ncbi:hypothetical protein AVEN_245406-1 [Araneus ventricosus]|uniref:Uncharacterized protein n=1 Tax=Araneus ventricosus TaxID=182803 RepID=A0A4Y2U051_ARAVE|nr:hypothetical protein AVEN_245406-1 [Araneus ventricosus]
MTSRCVIKGLLPATLSIFERNRKNSSQLHILCGENIWTVRQEEQSKPGFSPTHFNRKMQARYPQGSDLLSLSTTACQSLFDFLQSADFNLCYPRSEASIYARHCLFAGLFQGSSDFNPDGNATMASRLAP